MGTRVGPRSNAETGSAAWERKPERSGAAASPRPARRAPRRAPRSASNGEASVPPRWLAAPPRPAPCGATPRPASVDWARTREEAPASVPATSPWAPACRRTASRESFARTSGDSGSATELGLARDPALSGKVTVAFTVSKDGEVRTATVKSATLPATDVQACTAQAFRHLSFPPPQTGAPVEVVYAIKFQSPSEADPRHVESGAAQRGRPRTSEPVSATSWMQGGRGTCGARAASATCAVHLDCTVDQYCATPPAPGEPNRCQPKRPEGSDVPWIRLLFHVPIEYMGDMPAKNPVLPATNQSRSAMPIPGIRP